MISDRLIEFKLQYSYTIYLDILSIVYDDIDKMNFEFHELNDYLILFKLANSKI